MPFGASDRDPARLLVLHYAYCSLIRQLVDDFGINMDQLQDDVTEIKMQALAAAEAKVQKEKEREAAAETTRAEAKRLLGR